MQMMSSSAVPRFRCFAQWVAIRGGLLPLMLTAFFLLPACTTTRPPPHALFVQVHPSLQRRSPEIRRVAIVGDLCVTDDNNFISLSKSRQAEQYMLKAAQKALEDKGYTVKKSIALFVGGYKNPMRVYEVAGDNQAPQRKTKPPFMRDPEYSSDPDIQAAVQRLEYFTQLCFDKGFNRSARFSVNPHAREAVRLLADRTQADAILLVHGQGASISAGKAIGEAVATTVISAALTLGHVVVTAYSVSYLDSYVALIDVKTGDMLWSNSLRLKDRPPDEEKFYNDLWPYNVLYHLPAQALKAQTQSAGAAVSSTQGSR